MNKSLQILFGLSLILVLAYIAFLDVSTKIKDDLLTKTKVMFSNNNVKDVTAKLQGEGSTMSRTLVLRGTAISNVERDRIVALTKNIEGVCSIDNQITLYPVVPKVPVVPNTPVTPKVPLVQKSIDSIGIKSTEEKLVSTKSSNASVEVESTKATALVSTKIESREKMVKVPLVPVVNNKNVVVPTPVSTVTVPKVIEVEKIKLEGVK